MLVPSSFIRLLYRFFSVIQVYLFEERGLCKNKPHLCRQIPCNAVAPLLSWRPAPPDTALPPLWWLHSIPEHLHLSGSQQIYRITTFSCLLCRLGGINTGALLQALRAIWEQPALSGPLSRGQHMTWAWPVGPYQWTWSEWQRERHLHCTYTLTSKVLFLPPSQPFGGSVDLCHI